MARRDSIRFSNLLSLFILAAAPFASYFWFFIPFAVSFCIHSRMWLFKLAAVLSCLVCFYSVLFWAQAPSVLDFLAVFILFSEGFLLRWVLRSKASFTKVFLTPLLGAWVLGFLSFVSGMYAGLHHNFSDWASQQIGAEVVPSSLRSGTEMEILGSVSQILLRILKDGLLAWFGNLMAMALFVNGVMEAMFRGLDSKGRMDGRLAWTGFQNWRCPDWALVPLALGLISLALPRSLDWSWPPVVDLVALNLVILAGSMVFAQGIALVSFFIPRLSWPLFLILFFVLVIEPIPLLLLAGLADLWFDFRSKMRSDPKV